MTKKRNRISSMKNLRDHLTELFSLIGIENQIDVIVKAPQRMLCLMEELVNDKTLYDYLDSLDANCGQAIEKIKKRNLNEWNMNKTLAKYNVLKEELKSLEGEHNALKKEVQSLYAEREVQAEEKQKLETALSEMKEYMASEAESIKKQQMNWVREIISLNDTLVMRKSWLKQNSPNNNEAKRLINSQLQEIERCLKKMGVEIINDDGLFSTNIHAAESTLETNDPQLDNHIAETLRYGYRYGGEILRNQEVVLYVYGKENA